MAPAANTSGVRGVLCFRDSHSDNFTGCFCNAMITVRCLNMKLLRDFPINQKMEAISSREGGFPEVLRTAGAISLFYLTLEKMAECLATVSPEFLRPREKKEVLCRFYLVFTQRTILFHNTRAAENEEEAIGAFLLFSVLLLWTREQGCALTQLLDMQSLLPLDRSLGC